MVVLTVLGPLVAEFTTWLPPAIRTAVFGLAEVLAVAFGLALYFTWRGRFKSRIVADDRRDDELLRVA
jgi:hypothetical protein